MFSGHSSDGFFARDLPHTLRSLGPLGHVHGHTQRGRPCALADACLQHPQLALFNSELGVAHIFVVRLKAQKNTHQFSVNLRELRFQSIKIFGIANSGNDIFSLSIDQEVAVWNIFTSGCVAREANSSTRIFITVTKNHDLHIDGSPQIVGDLFTHAIRNSARSIPTFKYSFNCPTQLRLGLLRECLASFLFHYCQVTNT